MMCVEIWIGNRLMMMVHVDKDKVKMMVHVVALANSNDPIFHTIFNGR